VALAIAELAVRVLQPQMLVVGEDFYRPDPELGWTDQANFDGRFTNIVDFDTRVQTNSLGLRGGELTGKRPAVLGIGDSFMFGHGVDAEDSFLVRGARAAGAEPINAGVPGYDLCQAVDLAGRLLPEIGPVDAIVIAPCLANDEIDVTLGRGRMVVQHGYFVEPGVTFDPDSWQRRLLHPIFAHSHLVRFLRYSPAAAWIERRLFGRESIDRRSLQALLDAYRTPPTEQILRGDEETGACFARLHDLAAARGIPVLGLLIPDELEVRREKLAPTAAAAGVDAAGFDLDGPRERIGALLRSNGIEVVDPSAALAAGVAAGRRLWFTQDRHFTVAGSEIVGGVLADALRQALAQPTPSASPNGN